MRRTPRAHPPRSPPLFVPGPATPLDQLRTLSSDFVVLEQISFTVEEWQSNQRDILNKIEADFGHRTLVVRSSTTGEDSRSNSAAGFFESVLDLTLDNKTDFISAVEKVISSYSKSGRTIDPADSVLVQPQVENIIASRVNRQTIGFSSSDEVRIDNESLLKYINPTDIKTFGLIPELIGRFPVLTYLEPLASDALKRILTEPKNALVKQYNRLFEIAAIDLKFDSEVLDFIVEKAIEFKLGARGLRSICEAILNEAMFDLPSKNEKEFRVGIDYAKAQFSKSKLAKLRVA